MSTSPPPANVTDMDVDKHSPVDKHYVVDKPDAKVIIITNLTRNVVESHLKTVFGFYGEIIKTDLPLFGKSSQNRGKAALEYADPPSAHKAASHMDGGQLDGAILQVSLSDLPVRSRSRSPPRRVPAPRNARDRLRSISRSRSRSRTRSRSPPAYRRRPDGYPPRDSFRGRGFGRRGGPPGRDRGMYRRGRSRSRSRSRSPVRRVAGERPPLPRRRSPSYSRGGYGRARRSRSRSYSVRSSRSRTRSLSRSRSRSVSYSSYSRYSRSRSRSRSVSRARRSYSRDDIRDSRSRSPKDTRES